MKKGILTILLLLIVQTIFCQQELMTKKKHLFIGLNSCFSLSPYTYDINWDYYYFYPTHWTSNAFEEFNPDISIAYNKHSLTTGPTFWITKNGTHFDSDWKKRGFNVTYRYNFRDSSFRLNYNLFYNFMYGKFQTTENLPSYYNILYSCIFTQSTEHINNIVGVGISYSLFKNFTIGAESGIGSHLFRRNEKLEVPDHSIDSFNRKGKYFDYGQVTTLLRFYIGYKFIKI